MGNTIWHPHTNMIVSETPLGNLGSNGGNCVIVLENIASANPVMTSKQIRACEPDTSLIGAALPRCHTFNAIMSNGTSASNVFSCCCASWLAKFVALQCAHPSVSFLILLAMPGKYNSVAIFQFYVLV